MERVPVEIVGVVHPLGAGGSKIGPEEYWTLRISFQPWRRPDGALEERELAVWQPGLTHEALKTGMAGIQPYDVLRLRVYLDAPAPETGMMRADLVELFGKDFADTELVRRRVELQKPVVVVDPFFGTLTLDRSLNFYETTVEWNGASVPLYLPREDCDDEPAFFRLAQSLWDDPDGWDRRLRDFAVQELLELKNDHWVGEDEDEEPVTSEEFRECMTLEAIEVSPDGSFQFTYDDGDLFWGHVIQVGGTLAEGPTDAGIAG